MRQPRRTTVKPGATLSSLLLTCLLVSACGGGGVASVLLSGIGGTGIVFGTITGFGSVYVNGKRYDTSGSEFIVDGNGNASQADLSVGMVVRLEVDTENGVLSQAAKRVIYDDEIEGPVAATPVVIAGSGGAQKDFSIFGQTIRIDQTGTIFENTSFDDIDTDDLLEVSGFRISPTEVSATYVKKTGVVVLGVSEVELRGSISNLSSTVPQSFELNGVAIDTDAMTEIEVEGGVLVEGMLVEVEGIIQTANSIRAEEIEQEDEGFGEDLDEISLHGIITDYVSDSDFRIAGQSIDASTAQLSPPGITLGNGLEIEVEGKIVGGVLFADEVELREGEAELRSFVSSVDVANNRFEVSFASLPGTVVVNTGGQTQFEDEGPLQLPGFSLADLMPGDFIQVEGIEENGEVSANTVKRRDASNPDDSKLEGAVDSFVRDTSITILGIEYGVDPNSPGGTHFEGFADADAFFDALDPAGGDIVEIEDDTVADGIADKVELD